MNPTGYFLGSGAAELDRLRLQAKIYEEHTRWLLDRIPIQPGWRALDVACGPVGIVPLLAERVGPSGEVIGLDSDERMVESARAVVADQRLARTQIVVGDARRTGLPSSRFDLVHERLLWISVPDPESVLAEMIRLTRPGGFVVAQEVDTVSWLCEPPHPAWDPSLAMCCGYPASSIRERLYADGLAERFGILPYTGSSDADGTLRGLVLQARHIEDHLPQALWMSALCANDPICAQHAPGRDGLRFCEDCGSP